MRPAMLYGSDEMAMTKNQVKELETAEMRMFRWYPGWTRKDKVKNERIRKLVGVKSISTKAREN